MNDIVIKSRILEAFPHGFTTRNGGRSVAPFASLNLGGNVGDESDAVAANWKTLEGVTGLAFARVRQVHGDKVIIATAPMPPEIEADAIATDSQGLAAAISVADCVPIVIADPRTGAVAAAHAGWRGTLGRVAARAVATLGERFGAKPGDLMAAIGPSIGPCCYEVGLDLAERFRAAMGPHVANVIPRQVRLDLWLANRLILKDSGIPARQIEVLGLCTSCEDQSFFSHRRDEGKTGRQIGFIAPQPRDIAIARPLP